MIYNQGTKGIYLSIDGYGTVKVFTFETDAEGNAVEVVIDENATYTSVDDYYTIQYTQDNTEVTLYGYLGTYTYGSTEFNPLLKIKKL